MTGRDNFSRVGIGANPQLRAPLCWCNCKINARLQLHKIWAFREAPPVVCESQNPTSNTIDLTVGEVASMSMGYLPLASAVGVWRTILWQSAFACQL